MPFKEFFCGERVVGGRPTRPDDEEPDCGPSCPRPDPGDRWPGDNIDIDPDRPEIVPCGPCCENTGLPTDYCDGQRYCKKKVIDCPKGGFDPSRGHLFGCVSVEDPHSYCGPGGGLGQQCCAPIPVDVECPGDPEPTGGCPAGSSWVGEPYCDCFGDHEPRPCEEEPCDAGFVWKAEPICECKPLICQSGRCEEGCEDLSPPCTYGWDQQSCGCAESSGDRTQFLEKDRGSRLTGSPPKAYTPAAPQRRENEEIIDYSNWFVKEGSLYDVTSTITYTYSPTTELVTNYSIPELGSQINKHIDTIVQAKAVAQGNHISELRSLASVIITLRDNFTLETTGTGPPSISWFEVLRRLPKHLLITFDTAANKTILEQIARGDYLKVKLHKRSAASRNISGTRTNRRGRRGSGIIEEPENAGTIAPTFFDDARDMNNLMTAVASVTETNVAQSLSRETLASISNLKTVAGRPSRVNVLRGILNRIFRGQLTLFNLNYFSALKRKQASIKPVTIIPAATLADTVAFNLDYIRNFAAALDHTKYQSNRSRERIRNFFVPYEELDTRIGVLKVDGTIVTIPVLNSGTITVCKCAPPAITKVTASLFPYGGYTWEVTTTSGSKKRLSVISEKDHAYALTNRMKLIIDESMEQQGVAVQSADIIVTVETGDEDIELIDDNDSAVSELYILKADLDTVVTTYPNNYTTEYTLDYNLIEGTNSDIEAVVNDKFKYTSNYAAGCLEKGKDGVGADLFIRYIISAKKMKATFRTFSTDIFGDKQDKNLPIIVAGVPKLFYLCMTNNIKYNPGGAMSTLSVASADLFQRKITFFPSIDPDLASHGLKQHFSKTVGSWPGLDIDGEQTDGALEYKLDMNNILLTDLKI